MAFKAAKGANSRQPQIVVLVLDDSQSMAIGGRNVAVTKIVRRALIDIGSNNTGAGGSRYIFSAAKFGTDTTPLFECIGAAAIEGFDEQSITLNADSGNTNMDEAIRWADRMVRRSLDWVRDNVPGYNAEAAPTPIVVFASDGENTGPDVSNAVAQLHSNKSPAGLPIDVLAVGIGIDPSKADTLNQIASKPDYCLPFDEKEALAFLAEVIKTIVGKKEDEAVVVTGESAALDDLIQGFK